MWFNIIVTITITLTIIINPDLLSWLLPPYPAPGRPTNMTRSQTNTSVLSHPIEEEKEPIANIVLYLTFRITRNMAFVVLDFGACEVSTTVLSMLIHNEKAKPGLGWAGLDWVKFFSLATLLSPRSLAGFYHFSTFLPPFYKKFTSQDAMQCITILRWASQPASRPVGATLRVGIVQYLCLPYIYRWSLISNQPMQKKKFRKVGNLALQSMSVLAQGAHTASASWLANLIKEKEKRSLSYFIHRSFVRVLGIRMGSLKNLRWLLSHLSWCEETYLSVFDR